MDLSETESESITSTLGGSDSNYSPSRSSSPLPIPSESEFAAFNDNDMDVDSAAFRTRELVLGRRSATPTPETGSRQTTPVPSRAQINSTSQRLRTRRSKSSLTQSLTSPKAMHAIKSPNRAASNALSLQLQMQQMHTRHNPNPGSELDLQTGVPPLTVRPRRLFPFSRRRHASMPIPVAVPPPTMPLPALPPLGLLSPSPLEDSTQHNLVFSPSDTMSGSLPFARRRGLSKSSLAAEEHRIEEMKEN